MDDLPIPQGAAPVLPPPPKKRHRVLKIVLWTLAVLIVVIVCLAMIPRILGLFYKDIAPVNDTDLQLGVVNIPDAENAYYDLSTIGSSTDPASVMHAAAQKKYYQDPLQSDPSTVTIDTSFPQLNAMRDAALSVSKQAVAIAEAGKPDVGLQEAVDVAAVGNKMKDSQAPIIEWLVGNAVETIGLKAVQQIATSTNPSKAQLLATSYSLNSFTYGSAGLVRAIKAEHAMRVSSIENVIKDTGRKADFYWHPNETIGYLADETRSSISMAQQNCDAPMVSEIDPPEIPGFPFFTENLIGKILNKTIDASLSSAKTKECDAERLLEAARQTVAAKE